MGKGLTFSALSFFGIIAIIAAAIAVGMLNIFVGLLVFTVGFIALVTVMSAMDGIFKVALYRYACWNMVPEGFSQEMVQNAFIPKKK